RFTRSPEFEKARLIADAWCAAFVWKKAKGAPPAITHDLFLRVERDPAAVPASIRDEIVRLSERYHFLHWHLAFPDVFHLPNLGKPENENAGWCGGFDVVLGNPPWERVKLQEQEWFATR